MNMACRTIETVEQDKLKSLAKGSCILALTLTKHPFDILITSVDYSEEERDAVELVLLNLDGYLYIPNVCMYYNLLETTYRTIDPEYYDFALMCCCCLSTTLDGIKLDQLQAAESIVGLVRTISDPSEDSFNITSRSSIPIKNVDRVCNCILTSDLYERIFTLHQRGLMEKYKKNINTIIKDIGNKKKKKKTQKIICNNEKELVYSVKHLGSGQYGTVTSIKTLDGKKLARKEQTQLDPFIREVVMMACLKHKNIVHIHKFSTRDYTIDTSVYPYTLDSLIKGKLLTKNLIRHFTRQLFGGLSYLHSCGVMHGDLKPNNIFITSKQTLKLADFGMTISCCTRERRTMLSKYVSWAYRPYELYNVMDGKISSYSLDGSNEYSSDGDIHSSGSSSGSAGSCKDTSEYSYEIDIWAAGVMILQMYDKGFFASSEEGMKKGIEAILKDHGVVLTIDMEEDLGMVVRQCFAPAAIRPNALQCLSMLN